MSSLRLPGQILFWAEEENCLDEKVEAVQDNPEKAVFTEVFTKIPEERKSGKLFIV